MKIRLIVTFTWTALTLMGCGSTTLIKTNPEKVSTLPQKVFELSDDEKKSWSHKDVILDSLPGMSIERAYDALLKNKRGQKVVVAVIDSGIDIEHEDLDGVIWTNNDEIPNNGIDDDKNGYVDDVHGWNFLGDSDGENLELTRILKKGDDGSAIYQKAKSEHEKKLGEAQAQKTQIDQMMSLLPKSKKAMETHFGKADYSIEEIQAIESTDPQLNEAKGFLLFLDQNKISVKDLEDYHQYLSDQVDFHYNLSFDGRAAVGDDVDDIDDRGYGNANVIGPNKDSAEHGTHVSGIIAAERNNGIGMNGVASNVEIMPIRAVPNGDEYDKDIALAIRYAVDNGASIINTSFGKYYSTHPEWVWDAIAYAAKNNVLIVNAAGNESFNIDNPEHSVFPNDVNSEGKEISDTFITVGALAPSNGADMVAGFSNYGSEHVDVFAPGDDIWSCYPNNKYEFAGGTSMAAPAVSGVAALVRSYFPEMKAKEVKQLLMNSGTPIQTEVAVESGAVAFKNICKSGRIVNAYNALRMAGMK